MLQRYSSFVPMVADSFMFNMKEKLKCEINLFLKYARLNEQSAVIKNLHS